MLTDTPPLSVKQQINALQMPCSFRLAQEKSARMFFNREFKDLCWTMLGITHRQWTRDLSTRSEHDKQRLITAINRRYGLDLTTAAIDVMLYPPDLADLVFTQTPEYRRLNPVPTS